MAKFTWAKGPIEHIWNQLSAPASSDPLIFHFSLFHSYTFHSFGNLNSFMISRICSGVAASCAHRSRCCRRSSRSSSSISRLGRCNASWRARRSSATSCRRRCAGMLLYLPLITFRKFASRVSHSMSALKPRCPPPLRKSLSAAILAIFSSFAMGYLRSSVLSWCRHTLSSVSMAGMAACIRHISPLKISTKYWRSASATSSKGRSVGYSRAPALVVVFKGSASTTTAFLLSLLSLLLSFVCCNKFNYRGKNSTNPKICFLADSLVSLVLLLPFYHR